MITIIIYITENIVKRIIYYDPLGYAKKFKSHRDRPK